MNFLELFNLNTLYFGNSLKQWFIALGMVVTVQTILLVIRSVTSKALITLSRKTSTDWDDFLTGLVCNTRTFFLLAFAFYIGTLPLEFSGNIQNLVNKIPFLALIVQVSLWGNDTIRFTLKKYLEAKSSNLAQTVIGPLEVIAKSLLFGILFLLILDNFGVDITALITGLGIGGVAVALAAQSMLGDLFAAIAIIIDQPFVVGDFIVSGEYMGTVEYIGMKTTRLRSLSGELLVFSNSDLIQSRLKNYRNMYERRILFTIGVTYDTPEEKLEKIADWLKNIIEAQENIRFDRSHFARFGDSALIYEAVYFVLDRELIVYMDIHHQINLEITRKLRSEGVEFAFPTQTLHLVNQEPVASGT